MKTNRIMVVAAALLAVTLPMNAAFAQKKDTHESNTLRKIGGKINRGAKKTGKALEYSTRRVGEKTTLATHRAEGRKTRVHDRGKKKDTVITGDGKHIPVKRK